MGRYIVPLLLMPADRDDFYRKKLIADRCDITQAAFFLHFPHGHGQQVFFPVRMTAQPGPGIIDAVIRHQHFGIIPVHHPDRCRHVHGFVFPGKDIVRCQGLPNQFQIMFFLFIERDIPFQLLS